MRQQDKGALLFASSLATSAISGIIRKNFTKDNSALSELLALSEVLGHLIWYVGYIDSNVDEIKCATYSAIFTKATSMSSEFSQLTQPIINYLSSTKNDLNQLLIPKQVDDLWHNLVDLPDYLPARKFVGFLPATIIATAPFLNNSNLNESMALINYKPAEGTLVGSIYNVLVNYIWEYIHFPHHVIEELDLVENNLTYGGILPIDYHFNDMIHQIKLTETKDILLGHFIGMAAEVPIIYFGKKIGIAPAILIPSSLLIHELIIEPFVNYAIASTVYSYRHTEPNHDHSNSKTVTCQHKHNAFDYKSLILSVLISLATDKALDKIMPSSCSHHHHVNDDAHPHQFNYKSEFAKAIINVAVSYGVIEIYNQYFQQTHFHTENNFMLGEATTESNLYDL